MQTEYSFRQDIIYSLPNPHSFYMINPKYGRPPESIVTWPPLFTWLLNHERVCMNETFYLASPGAVLATHQPNDERVLPFNLPV